LKKLNNRVSVIMGLALVLLLTLFCGGRDSAGPAGSFSFNLKDLDGRPKTLQDYNKKLILIDFWTTWCIPCRISIPAMKQVYEKYQEDIALVGISLDTSDDSVVRNFVQEMEITYPVLLGGIPLARKHGISSVPTLLFVNNQGKILKTHTGVLDAPSLEAIIQNLI
jgi:thiol-disulfide isomerase/thioredoxin